MKLSGIVLALAALTGSPRVASASAEKLIYSFLGAPDGEWPVGRLVADGYGNLYGITFWGGSFGAGCGAGCGTVYKLTPPIAGQSNWSESVIYAFPGGVGGALPSGDIVIDREGNLYGSTAWGGSGTGGGCTQYGCGTVFELSPPAAGQSAWTAQTLYSFQGGDDGWSGANLMLSAAGTIFGTTIEGGVGCGTNIGCGTVFSLSPPGGVHVAWTEKVLYRFTGGKDGAAPEARLIKDAEGRLYGTTSGLTSPGSGGTAFMLSPPPKGQAGWTETVLHYFRGFLGDNSSGPFSPLIMDKAGDVFGTTNLGGQGCGHFGCGTLFELTPDAKGRKWSETVLYHFQNHGRGGAVYPYGGLTAGNGGKFYVPTLRGGARSYACSATVCGAVLALIPPLPTQSGWRQDVLHRFQGGPDDAGNAYYGLTMDGTGHFFGTAYPGGTTNIGAVYELDP